jgi:hypothetical protein
MITKLINREQFKQAIKAGFDSDDKIIPMYCPHVKVENVDDIVSDISERIEKSKGNAILKGVYENGKLIGYYVYEGKTLISFALNVKYRTRKYLKEFWSKIRSDLKGGFQSFLWTANQRGISWLIKNGMKVIAQDHLITHLIF